MTRRLALARETLTELSAVDLASVAGGGLWSGDCPSVPILRCLSLDPRYCIHTTD